MASGGRTLQLVSVIMPVHNGEAFIAEAISSVRRQTFDSWELIIADNASTDSSLAIAERQAREDPRIKVVAYSEFLRVVPSFNRAFRLMSPHARYCKPLGADDLLLPECLERMVDLAERHSEVGLVSAYRLLEARVDFVGIPRSVEVVAGPELCRAALLGSVWAFGSSSSTMIRADLVRRRDPFYDPDLLHADVAACFEVLQESSFGFVHQILTYTRRHSGAVSKEASLLMTHRAEQILMYQRFAPASLPKGEYERRLAVLFAYYVVRLAKHSSRLMVSNVRSYHVSFLRSLLASAGAGQLLRGGLLQVLHMIGGPRVNRRSSLAAGYGDGSEAPRDVPPTQ